MVIKFIISAILVCTTLCFNAKAEPVDDKLALLDFKNDISQSGKLNWDYGTSVCNNWTGITCNNDNSRVISLRLPAVGLKGTFPPNTLSRLSELRRLSLRSNGLSGAFPTDLLKLGNLSVLYLQDNDFEGPLPLDFSGWGNLTVMDLSNNGFNGCIPSSVSNLGRLTVLSLANNSFSGDVPDIDIPGLQLLDLSNNNFTGVVPRSLSRFPSSAFSGNCVSYVKHSSKFGSPVIVGIVIGGCVMVMFVSILLLWCTFSNRKRKGEDYAPIREVNSINKVVPGLTFFEGCSDLAFGLEDLLRASAEVLGEGAFGTTFKAALEDATVVVVKRLKEVVIGGTEFKEKMAIVGNIRHENVAPLRAYYYSKDEKFIVCDYYNRGSVSTLLHANRDNRNTLDWESRLNVAIEAATGLAHIHSQNGGTLVHGNIKATNIFINSNHHSCISDLGLATLMTPIASPITRGTGYWAPEVTDTSKVSQASDVYSFGVFLLELLTGISPVNHTNGIEDGYHLVRLVHNIVHEDWTGEVFDERLLRNEFPKMQEEMMAMLEISMKCVERVPEWRPKIGDVVKDLNDILLIDSSPTGGSTTPFSTPDLITPQLYRDGFFFYN